MYSRSRVSIFLSLLLPNLFWVTFPSATRYLKIPLVIGCDPTKNRNPRVPCHGILVTAYIVLRKRWGRSCLPCSLVPATLSLKWAYSIRNPFFLLPCVWRLLTSCFPSRLFPPCVVGLSRSPPGKPDIGDVDTNDRTLYRCRKVGRHDRPTGNSTATFDGDDGRDSDRSVSDYAKTGSISVTCGLDNERIRVYAGHGYSSDVTGLSRDIDSFPESIGATKVGPMTLGRPGGTEPFGSSVAGEHDHGAGNQPYVKVEDGNAGEDGKCGVGGRCRTRSNTSKPSVNADTNNGKGLNSNLQPEGLRPRDDQCEGTSFSL